MRSDRLESRLRAATERFAELESRLSRVSSSSESARLSREYAALEPLARAASALRDLEDEKRSLDEMMSGDDSDVASLAAEDSRRVSLALEAARDRIRELLLPVDEDDSRDAIVEIRAGTGGEEAALFASDLSRMYLRYAERRGWKSEVLGTSPSPRGGSRETALRIRGEGVFARLRFEAGTHRVQRVPETEAQGRIHTSAATVAVLPEVDERELPIPSSDLRIETMRSSGAGGQHVNTTDSAVRITHLPTGISVIRSEKSQHRNRARAMSVLRGRLRALEREKAREERDRDRRRQIGGGDRSERARTYNFPQGRVTDHRAEATLYKLRQILDGEALDELIDLLVAADRAAGLADFDEET